MEYGPLPNPPHKGRTDPLCPAGISPSMGRKAGAVLAVVTAPSHRGEGWGGVCSLSCGGAKGRVHSPLTAHPLPAREGEITTE